MDSELRAAVDSLAAAAQIVADKLPEHLEKNEVPLSVQFPRGIIRRLAGLYSRWPYLSQPRQRTVACAIQLCDFNRWHMNTWKVGLTAGTMWQWHCTLPVIAVIETLLYEYGCQKQLIREDAKFKKIIDTMQSKAVIDQELCNKLHKLREYRNEIHLYLKCAVEVHDGKPRKYNEAVETLHAVEKALREHRPKLQSQSSIPPDMAVAASRRQGHR